MLYLVSDFAVILKLSFASLALASLNGTTSNILKKTSAWKTKRKEIKCEICSGIGEKHERRRKDAKETRSFPDKKKNSSSILDRDCLIFQNIEIRLWKQSKDAV